MNIIAQEFVENIEKEIKRLGGLVKRIDYDCDRFSVTSIHLDIVLPGAIQYQSFDYNLPISDDTRIKNVPIDAKEQVKVNGRGWHFVNGSLPLVLEHDLGITDKDVVKTWRISNSFGVLQVNNTMRLYEVSPNKNTHIPWWKEVAYLNKFGSVSLYNDFREAIYSKVTGHTGLDWNTSSVQHITDVHPFLWNRVQDMLAAFQKNWSYQKQQDKEVEKILEDNTLKSATPEDLEKIEKDWGTYTSGNFDTKPITMESVKEAIDSMKKWQYAGPEKTQGEKNYETMVGKYCIPIMNTFKGELSEKELKDQEAAKAIADTIQFSHFPKGQLPDIDKDKVGQALANAAAKVYNNEGKFPVCLTSTAANVPKMTTIESLQELAKALQAGGYTTNPARSEDIIAVCRAQRKKDGVCQECGDAGEIRMCSGWCRYGHGKIWG